MRRILAVDDDEAMGRMLSVALSRRGFDVSVFASADPAFEALRQQPVDLVITDLNMKGMNGLELCERVVADQPGVPVIVITAFGSMELAIAAIRAGAYDFLAKPFSNDALMVCVERALKHHDLQEEVVRLREIVAAKHGSGGLLGESPAMREVYDLLERFEGTDSSVLITGESGTGKELVARALHERSRRSEGPFVAVNCAAVPEALLESELFGHSRGAFTDARSARTGLFVRASGGTLFLDEIGELPLVLQPKLLRALQERKVRPVGADAEVAIDVRVCAATNRDLETAVADQRFREDLFYRINVLEIALPPLRARGRDVLLLAQEFLRRVAEATGKDVRGISSAAAAKLMSYAWPGNVRELQNCMERAVALAQYEEIVVEDLPERIRDYTHSQVVVAGEAPEELVTMDEVERRYIGHVLGVVGGNKAAAARILGFDRTTLYRKLVRHRLVERDRSG